MRRFLLFLQPCVKCGTLTPPQGTEGTVRSLLPARAALELRLTA